MDFSVLQAIYKNDSPRFLDECLESIYRQTLKPAKIVIVKDGPLTSLLEKVLDEWKEKLPLEIHPLEKNSGLARALNFGMTFIHTELTARMDSDDICLPRRFELQAKEFSEHPELMICGSSIREFFRDKDGNETARIRSYPEFTDKNSLSLYKGTPCAHPSVMIKTELLKEYPYPENTACNEDIALWFTLLEKGISIRNISMPLLSFRMTPSSFRRRSIKKGLNEFFIYRRYLNRFLGFNIRGALLWLRLFFRMLPSPLVKLIYFSGFRRTFLKK